MHSVEVLDLQFWHFLYVCTCGMIVGVYTNVFCHRSMMKDLSSFYECIRMQPSSRLSLDLVLFVTAVCRQS